MSLCECDNNSSNNNVSATAPPNLEQKLKSPDIQNHNLDQIVSQNAYQIDIRKRHYKVITK